MAQSKAGRIFPHEHYIHDCPRLLRRAEFIALGDTEPVEFLLYLYFGKTEDDLKNFALRDLGIIRTNNNANLSARFTDGAEARACFHYSRLLDRLELKSEGIYRSAVADIFGGPHCTTDYAGDLRDRVAHRIGLYFEKQNETDLAIQLYRAGRLLTATNASLGSSIRAVIRVAQKNCCAV